MNSTGRVVIITFGAGMFNFSANAIGAYLRAKGHQTTIIQCVPTDEAEFEDIEDIKISVSEACTNVIQHAYKGLNGNADKKIDICTTIHPVPFFFRCFCFRFF